MTGFRNKKMCAVSKGVVRNGLVAVFKRGNSGP
jgi:hypothetical protein